MAGYADPFEPLPPGTPGVPTPTGFDEDFYLNGDPDAAFWKYLQQHGNGLGQNTPQAHFAQGRQVQTYNTYKADAASDANMGFWDWLKKSNQDFGQEFQNQSPEQRGDFSSRTMTPRARWVTG